MASAWSPEELDQLRRQMEEGGSPAAGAEASDEQAAASNDGALDAAYAEAAAEVKALAQSAPAVTAASPEAPMAPGQLVALERLFTSLLTAASAQVAGIFARIAELFGAVEHQGARRAIQDRVLEVFDRTARRIRDEQPSALERFVVSVAVSLRGMGILEKHPLGAVVDGVLKAKRDAAAAEREVASIVADAATDGDPKAAANKIVDRITKRLDGATKIVATRMLGAEVDAKTRGFCAQFDNRVLGANLSVLDRFETAVSLPEKFFDFDERFKIAARIFPGGIAGSDGADALGSFGRFAWTLGADIEPREGYEGLVSKEEALAFAEAQSRSVDDSFVMGDGGALGDLGALGKSVGLAGLDLSSLSRFVSLPASSKLSGASLPSSLSGGAGRSGASSLEALTRSSSSMRTSTGGLGALPAAAVSAIKGGDVAALNVALGGNVSSSKLDSLMSLGGLPSFRSGSIQGAGRGAGALSHLAMGFQSAAGGESQAAALRSIEKLSFGGMGMKGGAASFGYVASPSMSYATLPIAKLQTGGVASGPAPSLSLSGVQALETRLMPAARRSLGVAGGSSYGGGAGHHGDSALGAYAGVPSLSFAGAARAPKLAELQAATSTARRAALAGSQSSAAATVPAFAISSDSFGVPRFRGSRDLPRAQISQLAGLDLSGSVVAGPSLRRPSYDMSPAPDGGVRSPAPSSVISEVAPGIRVTGLENVAHMTPSADSFGSLSSGSSFGYTRDDFGVTRLQSLKGAERMLAMPSAGDLGGIDLAASGVTLSQLDLAGGMAAPSVGRGGGWMERLQAGGGLTASSVLGAESLRASLRDHAGAGRSLALGPVELSFPAASGAFPAAGTFAAPAGLELAQPGAAPLSPSVARRMSRGAASRMSGGAAPSGPRALRSRGRFMPAAIPAAQAAESGYVAATSSVAATSIRLGATPSRTVLGGASDLAFAGATAGLRPAALEKYYAQASSPSTALGGIGRFELASFAGGAPSAALTSGGAHAGASSGDFVARGDFAPLSLQRLSGVNMGAAASMPGMRFDLPAGASFDGAGFAPTARIGGAGLMGASGAAMADGRYGRVGRDVQSLRASYSGAKLWSGGMAAAAPELLDLRMAAAAQAGAIDGLGGAELLTGGAQIPVAIERGGKLVASEMSAADLAGGSLGWRAVRSSAPRIQGVYGASTESAPTANDALGLSAMGGFDAAHMPSMVNPRMATLGLDAGLAPTIDRLTARAQAIDPLTAKALAPVMGDAAHGVKVVRGPEATLAAQALGTPAFAAGGVVALGDGVDLSTKSGMQVLAHEAQHARAPRALVHRFVDKLGMPGEASAKAAGLAAAHVTPPAAGEGQVFGLVPKSVRGRFSDRFALDGWTDGDMRYAGSMGSAGGSIDAGLKLREADRALDLSVDHEFVRFAGDITKLPAAAMPVDLGSQLSGRTEIVARSTSGPSALGFAPRTVEMPLKAVFWGRKGGDRVARGGVEVREVALPGRFTALDPTRIEGGLSLDAGQGVMPASYRLAQGVRPAGVGAKDVIATTQIGTLSQKPGMVDFEAGDLKIGGRFGETSTKVRASGEFAADLTKSAAFVESIAPSAETLPKNAEFLAATGIDADAVSKVVEGNRSVAQNVKGSYVRRGGLPSAGSWSLSVNGGAPEAALSDAGALALNFKRASGPSEMEVPAESVLGRRLKGEPGRPLSTPVLDFMERFFKRDLSGMRVNDGPAAKELNRELGSEAFAANGEVFVGAPKGGEEQQIATLGHEIAHALEQQVQVGRPAARPAPRADAVGSTSQERRARDTERQILSNLRKEPKERRAPKLPMTHTKSASKSAEIENERAPIQKKKAADAPIQMFEKSGQVLPKPWEALFPRPPKRDLSPLVYQIWNKIKVDLEIEMTRRSGGF